MITAFRDDGRIRIDRSVDFEGYYYHDRDIHVSKIDINKKHPERTKEDALNVLNSLRSCVCTPILQRLQALLHY